MPTPQTKASRQPIRVVGTMSSAMRVSYAMAGSLFTRIETTRVGARAFGQLTLAGLAIL